MMHLQRREREYRETRREMTRKMIAGAGGSGAEVEEPAKDDPSPSTEVDDSEPRPCGDDAGSGGEQSAASSEHDDSDDDGSTERPSDGASGAHPGGMDERMKRLLAMLEQEDEEAAALARQAVERHLSGGAPDHHPVREPVAAPEGGHLSVAKQWSGAMAMACLGVAVSCLAAYSTGGGQ